MSEYLFLRDKNRCPQCRCRRSFSGGYCHACGIRLFIHPINFRAYEDEGNPRRYWLWTNQNGWIYRDHIIEGLQAQDRHYNITSPERVTKTAAQRAQEEIDKARALVKAHLPKRNTFGYGKSKTNLAAN